MRQARKSIFHAVSLVAMSSLLTAAAGPSASGKDSLRAEKMVAEILAAHADQKQIQCLTKTYGTFSIEQAYDIAARCFDSSA